MARAMLLHGLPIRNEVRPMLRLAVPVVLAEIGWVAMGVVDVMMVGRIDAESIGGLSVGRALFLVVVVFGIGLLLGLDTVVSQAFGADDRRAARRWLVNGVWLGLIITLPLIVIARILAAGLEWWGVEPPISGLARSYLEAVSFSALPLFLYTAFRRYLQAVNLVRPVMIALISANAVNVAGNWVLIFGKLGAPALGAVGAAWASVAAACYLAGFLLCAILIHEREQPGAFAPASLRLEPHRLKRLVVLGLPAAVQLLLEVGVFALMTTLAGRLHPAALAAHQIVLNAASVTFMVPLGVSSAAAVRVGQALGRGDPRGAATAGWTALLLGTGFMTLAALVFVLVPAAIVRAFTPLPEVVRMGVPLLYVAAAFQLFDGVQVVATGALRGAGDTRTPMLLSLAGYWALGLPAGYYLAFVAGHGAVGLWAGLCVGLVFVGSVLLPVWARRTVSWRTTA